MNNDRRSQLLLVGFMAVVLGLRLVFNLNPISQLTDRLFGSVAQRLDHWSDSGNDSSLSPSQALTLSNQALTEDNQRLRSQLSFAGRTPYQTLAADVTRKSVNSPRKFVIINRGQQDGVKSGNAVVSGGFLVGVVSQVDNGSAEVQLITDSQFRATATAAGAEGVIKTEYGSLIFDLVPKPLAVQTLIRTDGVDGVLPPGLSVGRTAQAIGTSDSIFRRYLIVLPVNPAQLTEVLVVLEAAS